jgi:hypothetical protein
VSENAAAGVVAFMFFLPLVARLLVGDGVSS